MGFLLSALLVYFINTTSIQTPVKEFHLNGYAQGTTYHITYYATDSVISTARIDSLFASLDSSLSLYKEYSIVNRFNASDSGMLIDEHLGNVVNTAQMTAMHTKGLFDITVYPLTEAWGFGPRKPVSLPPDSSVIKSLLPCVNSSLLELEWTKDFKYLLHKKKPCVKMDTNGIAQGYSIDVISWFLGQRNIHQYLIELGGEIRVKGRKPNGEKFSVGIEAPGNEFEFSLMRKVIYLDKGSVTTSGNYRKFYESKGQRISHLLNPTTGFSVQNELISVTVYSPGNTAQADAYDNALMAMGLKDAMSFIEKTNMAAYFIYRKNDGSIADTSCKKFTALFYP